MHRYKGTGKSSSIETYERLLSILDENNIKLTGNYIGVDDITTFTLDDVEINTTPYRIMKSVIPSLNKFKTEITQRGYKVVKAIKYNGTLGMCLLVEYSPGNYIDFYPSTFSKFTDIRGHKFGRLTPLYPVRLKTRLGWACRCDCQSSSDEPISIPYDYLVSKTKLSCGCLQRESILTHASCTKNKAKTSFIDSINKYDGKVLGEYVDNSTPVLCDFSGIRSHINPTTFKKTSSVLDKLLKYMQEQGDRLVKLIPVDNTGIFNVVVKIKNGSNLTFNLNSYLKFIKGKELFISNLKKIEGVLLSAYTGSNDTLPCLLNNGVYHICPHRFNNYMKYNFNKAIKNIESNGDKVLNVAGYGLNGAIFRIKTFDNAIVEFNIGGYNKFSKSRALFFSECEKLNIKVTSPYYSANDNIECTLDSAIINNSPISIYSKTIHAIQKFKKLIQSNGDTFISFTDWSTSGLKAKILTFDGATLEFYYGGYKDFSYGRKSFFRKTKKTKYKIGSPYIKSTEPILIDFGCKHEPVFITPNEFQNGRRCPKCSASNGEKIIMEYLDVINIPYEYQYKINSYNKRLSNAKYDIYIPMYNLIIEINGIQHYQIGKRFNTTQEDLDAEIINDMNKFYYALEHNYEYMIIDYREHKPKLALQRFKSLFELFKAEHSRVI